MAGFLARRIASGVIGLLVFASLMFLASYWLVPGDYTTNFIGLGAEEKAAMMAALGLDRPLWEQYLDWMGGLLRGDLGASFAGGSVTSQVTSVLPWSIALFALAISIGIAVGIPLGRRAGFRDRALSPTLVAAATATSIFPPWLALLIVNLVLVVTGFSLYDRLRHLDDVVWATPPFPNTVLWTIIIGIAVGGLALVAIARVTRLGRRPWLGRTAWLLVPAAVIWAWGVMGLLPRIVDLLGFISLPLLALSLTATGEVILVVAAAMTGTAEAPYSHTARAKGLTPAMIRRRHAGRATLLPAISRLAAGLPYALGGLVIIEFAFGSVLGSRAFELHGLSSVILFAGFQQRNTPLAIGAVVAIGVFALLVRLLVDIVHVALDPRVDAESGIG
ncbi:MAG TPA: ABC transporter permease [Acidimicrobiia bacterium]|nr:ABC transporter permease [Acidimicrobiia bacterium]